MVPILINRYIRFGIIRVTLLSLLHQSVNWQHTVLCSTIRQQPEWFQVT